MTIQEEINTINDYCLQRGLYLTIQCGTQENPAIRYLVGPTVHERQTYYNLKSITHVWGNLPLRRPQTKKTKLTDGILPKRSQ